jgi:catalase
VYHVKGGIAFGYFEVTADLTQWTRAAFLSKVGKRTRLLLRFSIVPADEGAPEAGRDVRGVAIKFYPAAGKKCWVKYHFRTEQGVRNPTDAGLPTCSRPGKKAMILPKEPFRAP